MKIASITPMVVKMAQEDSFGGHGSGSANSAAYFTQPGWLGLYSGRTETTLVRIETDDGLVGFGEGQSPVGPEVTAAVIEHVLAPMLIGRDPSDIAVLRDEMYQYMNIRGHYTGYMLHAISAIDIGLWDIRGKELGQPVAKLLGGVYRERIPAYVSGIRGRTVEEKTATAKTFFGQGFTALKTFLGFGVKEDLEHIEAFMSVLGSSGKLMVDVLWNYDVPSAIRLGRTLERLGVTWFEAPTAPEDIAGHAEIARALDIPVAAGETETTRFQFLRWLEARGMDIAQPDVARCGVTESRRIAELADTFHVPVALHSGILLGPGIAASLHVAAAVPNLIYQEYQPVMIEVANQSLKTPLRLDSGQFVLPEGDGLGIEIDEYRLKEQLVTSAS